MTADVVRFVDSIVASPTVRLDLNDEVKWWVKSFEANPPRLRRAMSSNAMSDGVFVSSSQYEARTLRIALDLRTSTQDDNATEIQKLARELDREDNFLMYQPVGMTKPVFFKLFRSDMSQIEQLTGPSAFRRPVIELLAEPFALGLRETLGPYTVNNDPAHATNPYGVPTATLGDFKGDVPPQLMIRDLTAPRQSGVLAIGGRVVTQAESCSLGFDTTNPGGGPDAAMSGTGTNNYVRTSFATESTMVRRVTVPAINGARGARVFAVVRRSDTTSVIKAQLLHYVGNGATATPGTVTIPATTSRQLIDLGYVGDPTTSLTHLAAKGDEPFVWDFNAERTSGTGTLDWDCFIFVTGSILKWDTGIADDLGGSDLVFDGVGDSVFAIAGDPFAPGWQFRGWIPSSGSIGQAEIPATGATPTNDLTYMLTSSITNHSKTLSASIQVDYNPRYLFVRPAAS